MCDGPEVDRMNGSRAALLIAATMAATSAARAQDASRPVRETAEVSLVEVPVRVTDRDGRPVRGLTARDFTLHADGRAQPIVGFDAIDLAESSLDPGAFPAAARRRFLLLFDLSYSRPRSIVGARRSAVEFVSRHLGPQDLAAVATFSIESGFRLLVTFSSDRAQLARAIETLGIEARREPADPLAFYFEPKALAISALERGAEASRNEASINALVDALETMNSMQKAQSDEYSRGRVRAMIASFGELARALDSVEGRKDVVLLSEGFRSRLLVGTTETSQEQDWLLNGQIWKVDADSRFGSQPLRNELADMTSLFRRSDCVIHSVDVAGVRVDTEVETSSQADREPHLPGGDRDSLFEFAEGTGGEYFRNSNDLAGSLERLLVGTSVVYLLAFHPDRPALDGRFHEIKVKVAAKGARVHARPGYYDRSVFRKRTALERNLSAADAIANEMPIQQIPIRMLAVPFAVSGGAASVPVQVEIPGVELLDGVEGEKTGLEVYVYAHGPENRLGDFLTQSVGLDLTRSREAILRGGIRFSGSLRLAPGAYRLRVFVRNSDTGRAGLVAAPLRVPDFSEGRPELLPPIFLDGVADWIPLRARPRGDAVAETASFPTWSVAGESVAPAALAAVPASGVLRLCLVSYHMGAESAGSGLRLAGQILDADGKPIGAGALSVLSGSAPDADGRRTTLLAFRAPRDLAAGRYGLRVFAEDGETGEKRQAVAAFRVP
jgi:VWFA-related protein